MLSGIRQHMVIHVLSLEVLFECHFQADNNVTFTFEYNIFWNNVDRNDRGCQDSFLAIFSIIIQF